MRGLAVLLVVLYHVGLPIPGGFVGVDIFFVISGFVIMGLLMREWDAKGRIHFTRFYSRRIRRLLPALTVVVLATILASFLLGSPFDRQQEVTALTGMGALLMAANAVIFFNSGQYFATPPTNNPLLNTWSLSVEEQFYIVFPFIVVLLLIAGTRSRKRTGSNGDSERIMLFLGLGLLAIASFVLSVGMTYGFIQGRFSDPDWFAFYSSPTRAWEFAAGALVFLAFGYQSKVQRPVLGATLVLLGTTGMILSAFVISESSSFPGYIAALPALAAAATLAGGSLSKSWSSKILATAPLARLGNVSYSWYLWHWPLIAFAVLLFGESLSISLIAALAALVLAVGTLRTIENPIRFRTRLVTVRSYVIALTCIALVAAASSALYFGARANWWNSDLRSMNEQVSDIHLWQEFGCDTPTPLGKRGPDCVWNSDASGTPIYLLGDSMAGMLSEGTLEAGRSMGSPVFPGALGACPFIDATLILDGQVDSDCRKFVQESLYWLNSEAQPGYILLASSFGYTTMGGAQLQKGLRKPSSSVNAKTANYLLALGDTVRMLSAAGHKVHVVLPTPGFPQTLNASWFWYPSQCSTIEALTSIESCGMSRSLTAVRAETAQLEADVDKLVRANGGVPLQIRDFLCTAEQCQTNLGAEWLFLDGTHITVRASEALFPRILNAFVASSEPGKASLLRSPSRETNG